MKEIELVKMKENLQRGTVLRCKGSFPYESLVDFMICESQEEDYPYFLMVITGFKAGLILQYLPKSSLDKEHGCAISCEWLINNWKEWGYADCPVQEVSVLSYETPKKSILNLRM